MTQRIRSVNDLIFFCIGIVIGIVICFIIAVCTGSIKWSNIIKFFAIIKRFFGSILCRISGHSKMNYFQGNELHCSRCGRLVRIFDDNMIRALMYKVSKDIDNAVINPRKEIRNG